MKVLVNNEMFEEMLNTFLYSFNGCLCTYSDKVKADGEDVSHLFGGEDSYASNYQKDQKYDHNEEGIKEMLSKATVIVYTDHDRSTGDIDDVIRYTKSNDGWVKTIDPKYRNH